MKKILLLILSMTFIILSCQGSKTSANQTVKVGFAGESDYQIWNPIVEKLAEEGITVELVSFSDYTIPNQALNDGEIDLNAFQHYAYFNDEVSNKGYDLTAIADTYISAMNIYSTNITDVKELKNGDKIAIPNDPSIYTGNSFYNLIAARTKDKDNEIYKKIVEAYQSPEVEKVYAEDFKGAYLPTWK